VVQNLVRKKVMLLLLTGLKILRSEIQVSHISYPFHDDIPGFQGTAIRRKSSFDEMEANGVVHSQGDLPGQSKKGCP
jgi:hypothetical protein